MALHASSRTKNPSSPLAPANSARSQRLWAAGGGRREGEGVGAVRRDVLGAGDEGQPGGEGIGAVADVGGG